MDPFPEQPVETREAIMKATYDALTKHGYTDLTIQRISDEFAKSKSLLYHHYDSKDDLLIDFLGFMLERMESRVPIEDEETAYAQVLCGLEHVFTILLGPDRLDYLKAVTELRAQATHDEAFREQFTKNDQFLRTQMVDIIEAGIEEGVFREVDPEHCAEMLLTTIAGTTVRQATVDDLDRSAIHSELVAYVDERMLADDADVSS